MVIAVLARQLVSVMVFFFSIDVEVCGLDLDLDLANGSLGLGSCAGLGLTEMVLMTSQANFMEKASQ